MGIMEDISGYFNQGPPASDSYLGQVMDYGMRFGGSQFGITPQQTAAYMEDRKSNQTQDFIRKNMLPGDPNARPIGNNLAELDANIAAGQQRFNPAMEMELAARTGTLGQYMAGMQAMQRQQQAQVFDSNNMTAAQYAAHTLNSQKANWDKARQDLEFNSLSAAQKAQLKVSQANTGIAQGHLGLAQKEFNAKFMPDPNNPNGFLPRTVQSQAPSGYQWTPQGTLAAIPGGPATKPTAEQERAASGLQTMLPSLELINQGKGNMGLTEASLAAIPGVGPTLAKWAQSGPEGAQRAAEGVFAANYIHAMSGAAASEQEVKRLTDSIFVRPGDNKQAIAQKATNRNAIMQGQNILSGNRAASAAPVSSKVLDYNPKTGRLE